MQSPIDPNHPPIPEMVGATSDPFPIRAAPTFITFDVHAPTGPALIRDDRMPRTAHLGIENITGKVNVPAYAVYLNLPEGSDPARHPFRYAGSLPMFGLVEMSQARGHHPANGLTYRFDVTNVLLRLAVLKEWDARTLRVTFIPEPWPQEAEAQIGRVSLYFQ